jgi:hypothetical protein
MGLDSASLKFCCAAKSLGVDFRTTLMVGRQSMFSNPLELRKVFDALGVGSDPEAFLRDNKYGEAFFTILGASSIASLDYHDYEGADIIHDLNFPVPEALKRQFSVVYDGGTLEHIFNIPQALKNCMDLVEVGGHFLQANVANNFMGHGFWQFSPELLFRVFSEQNGFRIKAVLIHERVPCGSWFLVKDPDEVQERVILCNSNPTYILTIAQKVKQEDVFRNPPLQSDYVGVWAGAGQQLKKVPEFAAHGSRKTPLGVFRSCVSSAANRVRRILAPLDNSANKDTPFGRSYYRPVSEKDLLKGHFARNPAV